jgi:hypothetical protein
MEISSLEWLLRQDRRWTLGGLSVVIALCWGYLIAEATLMTRGESLMMPMATGPWALLEVGLMGAGSTSGRRSRTPACVTVVHHWTSC